MKTKYVALLMLAAVAVSSLIASSVTARGTPIAYWGANRLKAYYLRDYVGIGTSNPTSNLHVTGVNNGPDILTADETEVSITAPLTLGDDLTVGGNLGVTLDADVGGTLQVSGSSTLDGTLNVTTNAGGGHVARFENTADGSGVAIRVNDGTPDNGNNFVTFQNGAGGAVGRIEGQTSAELLGSFEWIWQTSFKTLESGFAAALVIADLVGIDDFDAAVVEGLQEAAVIAQWVQAETELQTNVGVAFESGSGDYAEWLEKADPEEVFSSGDIVGVRAGKISKSTDGADHYMVISKSPIVLGNMPPEGRKADFEKVAFMGQVGVKVVGKVNKGDYILPSSKNDGFAIAVGPKAMTLKSYEQIVGVAWQASSGRVSYVNTAVGINANDLVAQLIRQQQEIDSVKRSMNTVLAHLHAKDPSFSAEVFDVGTDPTADEGPTPLQSYVAMTPAERTDTLVGLLKKNLEMIEAVQADARARLDARGVDYRRYEQTERLLTDPEYMIDIVYGR